MLQYSPSIVVLAGVGVHSASPALYSVGVLGVFLDVGRPGSAARTTSGAGSCSAKQPVIHLYLLASRDLSVEGLVLKRCR